MSVSYEYGASVVAASVAFVCMSMAGCEPTGPPDPARQCSPVVASVPASERVRELSDIHHYVIQLDVANAGRAERTREIRVKNERNVVLATIEMAGTARRMAYQTPDDPTLEDNEKALVGGTAFRNVGRYAGGYLEFGKYVQLAPIPPRKVTRLTEFKGYGGGFSVRTVEDFTGAVEQRHFLDEGGLVKQSDFEDADAETLVLFDGKGQGSQSLEREAYEDWLQRAEVREGFRAPEMQLLGLAVMDPALWRGVVAELRRCNQREAGDYRDSDVPVPDDVHTDHPYLDGPPAEASKEAYAKAQPCFSRLLGAADQLEEGWSSVEPGQIGLPATFETFLFETRGEVFAAAPRAWTCIDEKVIGCRECSRACDPAPLNVALGAARRWYGTGTCTDDGVCSCVFEFQDRSEEPTGECSVERCTLMLRYDELCPGEQSAPDQNGNDMVCMCWGEDRVCTCKDDNFFSCN